MILNALKRLFKEEGFDIAAVESGEEALAVLAREPVDLIITDENMPGLSGTELLNIVRRKHHDIIRIMLTGLSDIEVAKNAINKGEIYRFFVKPWDDVELLVSVRHAFAQKLLQNENERLKAAIEEKDRLLKKLEAKYPGITSVCTDQTGAYIIEDK